MRCGFEFLPSKVPVFQASTANHLNSRVFVGPLNPEVEKPRSELS